MDQQGGSAESAGLKLRAKDGEDMGVIAAVLQDALVPLSDVVFQHRQRRFVMVANRFMWEDRTEGEARKIEPAAAGSDAPAGPASEGDAAFEDEAPPARYRRVNCGLRFEQVEHVQYRGIDLRDRDQILNMLTIDIRPESLVLLFSEGAAIRLIGQGIACQLEDIGEPWPTDRRPSHRLDEAGQPD